MPVNLFVAEFIGAPKMNTFKTELALENGQYYVKPYGAKIPVDGNKAEMLKEKQVQAGEIILGVRPEHITLAKEGDEGAIPCQILVNEMMGSELHLHVNVEGGDRLIIRVPTISLDESIRNSLNYGTTIYITFEGKVMHFFDKDSQTNLLV
jgi:multiple sugar transport system ATP-binding protein